MLAMEGGFFLRRKEIVSAFHLHTVMGTRLHGSGFSALYSSRRGHPRLDGQPSPA